jgi:hypothetical protein
MMGIALRYIAAPVLAASVAVTIAGATASAADGQQPAHSTDVSTASLDHGGAYCGQFCGDFSAYDDHPGGAVVPVSYGVGTTRLNPLSPVSIRLPIVDAAGVLTPQH